MPIRITRHTKTLFEVLTSSYFVAFLALGVSLFTAWDNYFNFKIDVSAGRDVGLQVAKIANGKRQPAIFMSVAFINSGGKTGYISDVKLKVKFYSNNNNVLEEEFYIIREYESLMNLHDQQGLVRKEILPLVIIGKTIELRKYIFLSSKPIPQQKIPKVFDLNIEIYAKTGEEWTQFKEYKIENITPGIWQDLESDKKPKYRIAEMFEKRK